jgi:hypothetical protein
MLAGGIGLDPSRVPVVVLAALLIMLAVGLLAVGLPAAGARQLRPVSAGWLRPTLWP